MLCLSLKALLIVDVLLNSWKNPLGSRKVNSYDLNGVAQPLPRTLPRTGFNSLHVVPLVLKP